MHMSGDETYVGPDDSACVWLVGPLFFYPSFPTARSCRYHLYFVSTYTLASLLLLLLRPAYLFSNPYKKEERPAPPSSKRLLLGNNIDHACIWKLSTEEAANIHPLPIPSLPCHTRFFCSPVFFLVRGTHRSLARYCC